MRLLKAIKQRGFMGRVAVGVLSLGLAAVCVAEPAAAEPTFEERLRWHLETDKHRRSMEIL